MAQSETLKEFLVKLGFDVDGDSWRRFSARLREATHVAEGVGAAVVAAATAAVASSNEIAASLQQLGFAAERAHSTVASLQALAYAAQRVGLSGESMQGMVESMREMILQQPGLAGVLRNFGIDANENSVKVFDQLIGRLRQMPFYVASQFGSMFGIDPQTLLQLEQHYKAFLKSQQQGIAIQKEMGVNLGAAAKAANAYEKALRQVEQRTLVLREGLLIELQPALTYVADTVNHLLTRLMQWIRANRTIINQGIVEFVKGFRTALQKIPWGEIVAGFKEFGHGMEWIAGHVGGWQTVIVAALAAMTLRITGMSEALGVLFALLTPERLAILGVVGAALASYRAFEFYKKQGGGDALAGFKKEIANVERQFAAAGGDESKVTGAGALPLGLRHNNPGNLMPGGAEQTFPTMAAGLVAMGKLLVKYTHTGANTIRKIISRYAPASAGNPTASYIRSISTSLGINPDKAIDLQSHPQLLARLMGTMIRFEQGQQPFGSSALLAAARSAEGARVTNDIHPDVKIYVNGTGDPATTANEVGKAQSRVNRDILHNLRSPIR